jgi:hypothetical protein
LNEELACERLAEKTGGHCGREQDERQHKPLPACQHIGTARPVKHHRARPLNRTDPRPPGQQRSGRQQRDQEDDDHFGAHKRRDYNAASHIAYQERANGPIVYSQ